MVHKLLSTLTLSADPACIDCDLKCIEAISVPPTAHTSDSWEFDYIPWKHPSIIVSNMWHIVKIDEKFQC